MPCAATLVKRTRASLGGVPAPIADQVEALVARATRVVVEGPAFAARLGGVQPGRPPADRRGTHR